MALAVNRLLPPEQGVCYLLPAALDPEACARWIDTTERLGYRPTGAQYPAAYRDNDRLVFDDAELAGDLLERMRPHLPERIEHRGVGYRLLGLNPRFRCCRYRDGQRFSIHRDGAYERSPQARSLLTFMLYLNDGEAFQGGATRFFATRDATQTPTAVVSPRCGSLIVFGHDLWHEGQAVTGGTKYVLRSDVIYERAPAPRATGPALDEAGQGHTGYVWKVLALRDGRLASASRDGTIRLWRQSRRACAQEQVLRVDRGSVTTLLEGAAGRLWSGGRDGSVRAWTLRDDALTPALAVEPGLGAVLDLAALPGDGVAVAGAGGLVLLDAEGRPSRRLRGHAGWVWAVVDQGDHLLSAGEDGAVLSWQSGESAPRRLALLGEPARALAPLLDGQVAVGTAAGSVYLLSTHAAPRRVGRHAGAVRALLPLPGDLLASAGEDDQVRIWTLAGAEVSRFAHDDFVTSLARARDGRLVSASYDGTLRCWNVDAPAGATLDHSSA